eukprot:c4675_g1_i1.p1 GENE.c4675_g1_i1~~c4675_g1_i1.p1  ORF type:complete len:572 (+),score=130.56 c4675_g1_i1:53-1768(+)
MELECLICLDPFTLTGTHIPLLLPCSHSLCQGCLSQLAPHKHQPDASSQTQLPSRCPVCREHFPSVPAPPENTALIEFIKQSQNKLDSQDQPDETICNDSEKIQLAQAECSQLEAELSQLEIVDALVAKQLQDINLLEAESAKSLSTAEHSIKLATTRLKHALDTREQELISQARTQHEAAVKSLELQRGHLDMMQQCVRTMQERSRQSRADLTKNECTLHGLYRISSALAQTKSLAAQYRSLGNRNPSLLLPNNSPHFMVPAKQIERECDTIINSLHHFGTILTKFDKVNWEPNDCTSMQGGESGRLSWNDGLATIMDEQDFERKYTVSLVSVEPVAGTPPSATAYDGIVPGTIVYQGPEFKTTLSNLRPLHHFLYKIDAEYTSKTPTSSPFPEAYQAAIPTKIKLTTLSRFKTNPIPPFAYLSKMVVPELSNKYATATVKLHGWQWGVSNPFRADLQYLFWKIKIHHVEGWLWLGVIDTVPKTSKSFDEPTSFGFHKGISNDFASGDSVVFKLDRASNLLYMKHKIGDSAFSQARTKGVTPNLAYRIHVSMLQEPTSVEIAQLDVVDLF